LRQNWILTAMAIGLCSTIGCNKTWTDDEGNFTRVFHYERPSDIHILRSSYWRAGWGRHNFRYFFAERHDRPQIFRSSWERETKLQPDKRSRYGCGGSPPEWFVPKSPDRYDMWVNRQWSGIRAFIDKEDGTIYECGGRP
jgi:hypothetical protein